jgi:DNA-binding transcriptional ArsR family regulator
MTETTGRQVKDGLYAQFSRIGKAVAHPKRIELLDLLCQGERSVEVLANAAALSVTNASAHLRVLREARLVETRPEGTRVYYRLASESVCDMFFAVRDLAAERYAEVEMIVRDYFEARDQLEPISREEFVARVDDGAVLVLDVLHRHGFRARRLQDGLPEWRQAGHPVDTSTT